VNGVCLEIINAQVSAPQLQQPQSTLPSSSQVSKRSGKQADFRTKFID